MLRALILDFNGIIADDEPVHFELFARVMDEEGVSVSRKEYDRLYLHLNDKDAFETALQKNRVPFTPEKIIQLINRKSAYYKEVIQTKVLLFPDAPGFVRNAAQKYPLAIASGAFNTEIEFILNRSSLLQFFPVIIGAEKAAMGKPNPECYLTALKQLNLHYKKNPAIKPSEVLVIEDSVGGIVGAHRAGMACLAVTNSYPEPNLKEADFIVKSLSEINLDKINAAFEK